MGYNGVNSSNDGISNVVIRDVNGNSLANNLNSTEVSVNSASGTTVLTAASARIQKLTGTNPQTFQLPDATTLALGWTFEFNNTSTGVLTIVNNASGAITTIPSGGYAKVTASSVGTSAGTWDTNFLMPSNASYGTAGMTVTGTIRGTTSVSSPQLLATGTGSGIISILPQAAAGTYNFNLPTSAGSSGQPLLSAGGGASPMTFGTLGVAGGGTGNATLTAHSVLVGEGTSAIAQVGPSATAGAILLSTGSTTDPAFIAPTAGSGLTVTTNGSTLSYAISAPVSIANGGTNATSFSTSNGIAKYDGTSLVTSSTFTINASNITNNSSQPLVSAYVNATVNNVTGDGTGYVILFNTVRVNNTSSYSSGTGIFTAPVAGNYLITGGVCCSNISASHTAGIIEASFTGINYLAGAGNYGAMRDANNNLCLTYSVIAPMAASDQVFIGVIVSNGTKTVGINSGGGSPITFLGIYLLS